MKHVLKILSLFFLFSSCARQETNYTKLFPVRKDLQLTKVKEIPSDQLGMPGDIFCIRDYFIIQDEIDNYWYSLFNKKTGELIRYFAPKGRGPQEILYPMDQGVYGDDFYVYDSSLEIIHIYSLDSLLAHKDNCITKSIRIRFKDKKKAQCRNLVLLESGEIIANCCHPEGHLVLFDTTGMEKKAFFPDYPYDPLHKEENYIPKSYAFQYNCRIDPKNEKLYNISTTTGHFEIFNIHKDSLERIVNNVYYLPKYENTCSGDNFGVLFLQDNTPGLFNPEVTNKYIYAGYEEQPAPHTHMAYDVLYQFNLDGTPAVCYNLSNRISRFFIDNDTGILYAISADPVTREPHIYQAKVE